MKKEKLNSINEALNVLDSAIQEGSDEIKDIIRTDYHNLKTVLEGTAPKIKTTLKDIGDRSMQAIHSTKDSVLDFSSKMAKDLDKNVHEGPWRFLSGVAVTSLALGFWMGRKSRGK